MRVGYDLLVMMGEPVPPRETDAVAFHTSASPGGRSGARHCCYPECSTVALGASEEEHHPRSRRLTLPLYGDAADFNGTIVAPAQDELQSSRRPLGRLPLRPAKAGVSRSSLGAVETRPEHE